MAKELKRRGLRFVGPTTCYALMQAAGSSTTTCKPVGALPLSVTRRAVDRSDYRPLRSMRKDGRQGILPCAPHRACHGWYR